MSPARSIPAALLMAATAAVACERENEREPAMQPASRFVSPPEPANTASPGPGVSLSGASTGRRPQSVDPGGSDTSTWGTGTPETAATTARMDTRDAAALALTGARCDFEYRCQRIGVDRKYSTRDACERELTKETYEDLDLNDCGAGVGGSRLDNCVQQIRQQSCDASFNELDDLSMCDPDLLCGS